MDETRLRALLSDAVSAEPPAERPLGRIEADSRRLGRRRRRRRRIESAVASVASVAVVAVTVSFASGAFGPTHSQGPADHRGGLRQMAYVLTLSGSVVPVNLAARKAGRPLRSGLKGFGTFDNEAVVAPGGRTLYVSTKAGRILLISAKTGRIERTIRVAGIPEGADQLLAGANSKVAYAPGLSAITPIDLVTGKALGPIPLPNPAGALEHIAMSSNGRTLLAAVGTNINRTLVTVVTDRRAQKSIRLNGNQGETCLAVNPDGTNGYLFRTLPRPEVVPFDVATNKPLRPIKLRSQNYGVKSGLCTMAVAPNGRTAYVQIGRYVAPVDLVTGRALQPIKLPEVSADFEPQLEVDPDGRMAYELGGQWVFPIDLVTHKTLPTVSFAAAFYGFCISFSPKGGTVLVGVADAHNTGKLLLIQAATGKAGKAIRVPGTCSSIAELGTPSTSSSALSP
jgi:hypothetical protein